MVGSEHPGGSTAANTLVPIRSDKACSSSSLHGATLLVERVDPKTSQGGTSAPHTCSLVCTLLAARRVLPAISHPKKVQQLGYPECFFIPDLRWE